MKKLNKKVLCTLLTVALLSSSVVFAQSTVSASDSQSSAPTWESEKLARQQAKEAKAAEKAAKKAEKERLAQEKLAAKLEKMTAEQRAEYEAKEAEKAAAAAEKQAAKEASLAEKQAVKEAKDAEKAQAKAEKDAAKEAALQEKLAAMTPEQREKYDAKQELKAKVKADIEADRAMRKATIAETKNKVDVPYFSVDFEEGVEINKVTRVILKDDRSNFVFRDTLAGAYLNVKTNGFKPINPMLKVSALMGMGETFNNMKVSTSTFNYGVDGFLGLDWRASFWDYLFLNITPGGHILYHNADRFDYLNLGLGGYVSLEFPIAYHWTIVLAGQATYDWGNFGTNSLLETYDHVWQTGVDFGVCYSTKHVNKYNYVGQSPELIKIKRDRIKALKDAKKAEKQAKKDAKKQAALERKAAKEQTQGE